MTIFRHPDFSPSTIARIYAHVLIIEQHRSIGITDMFLIDVVAVRPLCARTLELTFADGLCAAVDMNRVISRYSGVFEKLTDDAYFRQVHVDPNIGTIAWPNGADICPDVLYSFASGKPIFVENEGVSRGQPTVFNDLDSTG